MSTGHDIAMALRSAYWFLHRQSDAVLARHDVTTHQFVLLSLLAEQDGITQQDLVRRASSDANTVRAILLLLESKGLLVRTRHPTDGRARSVALTAKGRRVHQRLWIETSPLRDRIAGALGSSESDALVSSLNQITETLSKKSRVSNRSVKSSVASA